MSGGAVTLAPGDYGPVAEMMDGMLRLGRSGLLEGAFAADGNNYYPYTFDATKALLFFAIASPYTDTASHLKQLGNPQWGIVHETGNYPGAWWLDAYQVWYEVPAIANADNADLIVVVIMTSCSWCCSRCRSSRPATHPARRQGLPAHLARLVPKVRAEDAPRRD